MLLGSWSPEFNLFWFRWTPETCGDFFFFFFKEWEKKCQDGLRVSFPACSQRECKVALLKTTLLTKKESERTHTHTHKNCTVLKISDTSAACVLEFFKHLSFLYHNGCQFSLMQLKQGERHAGSHSFCYLKLSLNSESLLFHIKRRRHSAASPAESSKGMKQNIFKSLVQDISPYQGAAGARALRRRQAL